ncbi:hypothetical protein ANNAL29_47 [Mycobacterium phage AnnaL29]|uniref:hypothetical protein n=1 Tax=Mycobacterium phage AnnaL29 TaxID=1076630 RepID=UPI00024DEB27|nr:hypothetical protein O153_gp60 [Mycobacterium phage AnnaL29]AGS82728.1 hypothetical protein ANNAL29_47 [Mycobacterium phage AnnaL29]
MIFTLSNEAEGLWPNKVRLTIDTDTDTALKVLNAARKVYAKTEEGRRRIEENQFRAVLGLPPIT